MSADFRDEPRQEVEIKVPMSEEEIVKNLTDELNSMFSRENLEKNPSLIFKMNHSLEIPVIAIYKEKRISSICTNLALIREALNNSTSLTYNREKEIITPNIKPLKNKIILNKIPDIEKDKILRVINQSPEYIHKVSDKYIPNIKSYTLILRTEESALSLIDKIKAAIAENSQLEIKLDYEELYLDLLQKGQDFLKYNQNSQPNFGYDQYYQNYGYYYGMNNYGGQYMMGGAPYGSYRGGNPNNNYYQQNYYDQMFIRKAQDDVNDNDYQRDDYRGSGRYEKRKDKYSKKPYYSKNQRGTQSDTKQMSAEEIKRRTRVNSENFPPLLGEAKVDEKKEEEEVRVVETETPKKRQRYHKDDFVKLFQQMRSQVKPSDKLLKFNENQVPVLNLGAKAGLEFIEPSMRKSSETFSRKAKEENKEKN